MVAATAAIAVATGAAGWFAGTQVRSPADAAADHRPPPASLITVAVQERTLTATVNAQGTVAYGAPKPLTLTGSVATGPDAAAAPIVTKAPVADRTLREGDVLLEVSGRPVFVLAGTVPMYRTLTRGSVGDDVRQVRAALRRLLPGRYVSRSGPLDTAALGALDAWYERRGYAINGPTAEQHTQLRQLQQAAAAPEAPAEAKADLAEFRKTYGDSVPSGEILFLPRLPIRLTAVKVRPGAPASGLVGTVADPGLVVNGTVSPDDADLIKVGMRATLEHPDGDTFAATVSGMGASVAATPPPAEGEGGAETAAPAEAGIPIRLKPRDEAKLASFVGQAFKVGITVGGTGHAVLSVPVSAVFTASDGQARVTVQDPGGAVRDVAVKAGLSTGGYVQITPAGKDAVRAGDRAVVGNQ